MSGETHDIRYGRLDDMLLALGRARPLTFDDIKKHGAEKINLAEQFFQRDCIR